MKHLNQASDNNPTPPAPLFERIGGRDKILHLLRHFYADVRQHEVIGPIFTAHIADWPAHLEKIADFWSGITGGPTLYRGAMPMAHISLGLKEEHFTAWLGLWRRNCQIHLSPGAAEDMTRTAEAIGKRLRFITSQHPLSRAPAHASGPNGESRQSD